MTNNSDLVFPPAARRTQEQRGSARAYADRVEQGFPNTITADLAQFIARMDTAFLGTVTENGSPYIQHRGGPRGFIKIIDEKTLGFADYRGNRQYITISNIESNDRAFLFLLDPASRSRIKIWGRLKAVEGDKALIEKLFDEGYKAKPERVLLFTIEAWDVNCSQHITERFTKEEIQGAVAQVQQKIVALEAENKQLRAALDDALGEEVRMNHDKYDDSYIRGILHDVKSVAIVGASPKDNRPSHFVVKYLAERGYKVFPINPGQGGSEIGGHKAYATLADVPEPIDMIDVFRSSDAVPGVLDETLALSSRPKVFWMQLGVRDEASAARAEAAGMKVVMDRCPKIEYGRLSGEINWAGVNTRKLSSKRPKRLEGGVQRLSIGQKVEPKA